MAVLLGLAAAVAFGVSDFLAGVLSRRIHFTAVSLVSQASSTVLAGVAALVVRGPAPGSGALAWGAASGLGGALGALALYRGLARGRMSVVGPLSAVAAAALPAVVGIALGERPSAPAVAGVLLALPGIWLVARPSGTVAVHAPAARGGVVDGLLAGVGFAVLFLGLDAAGSQAGLWPVVASQLAAVLVVLAVVAGRRPPGGLTGAAPAAVVGVLGVSATLLYFYATHSGLLTIVVVLTSLYPGVTVLMAALLLHERIGPAQRAGLALCAVAVTAIVVA